MAAGVLAVVLASGPASAQRLVLDGGNDTTARTGPSGTEISRSVRGSLDADLRGDSTSVSASGSAGLGIDGTGRDIGGSISIGGDPDTPDRQAGAIPTSRSESESTTGAGGEASRNNGLSAGSSSCSPASGEWLSLIGERADEGISEPVGNVAFRAVPFCPGERERFIAGHADMLGPLQARAASTPAIADALDAQALRPADVMAMEPGTGGDVTLYVAPVR